LIAHLVRRAMLYLQLRKKPSAQNSPLIASRLYVEMLRALKKAGLTHQETQTPNEFAAQIKRQRWRASCRNSHSYIRQRGSAGPRRTSNSCKSCSPDSGGCTKH